MGVGMGEEAVLTDSACCWQKTRREETQCSCVDARAILCLFCWRPSDGAMILVVGGVAADVPGGGGLASLTKASAAPGAEVAAVGDGSGWCCYLESTLWMGAGIGGVFVVGLLATRELTKRRASRRAGDAARRSARTRK